MSALNLHAKRPFALTGWHVLAIVCAFFGVVMGVDGVFTYLALKTHPGEVSVTPYEDGLVYDRHIAQMRAQTALGWQAGAAAEPGRVAVVFHDAAGKPLSGLNVTGKLERPATEAGRLTPKFAEAAPGRYEAAVPGVRGSWDLSAEARDAKGHVFLAERRLSWP